MQRAVVLARPSALRALLLFPRRPPLPLARLVQGSRQAPLFRFFSRTKLRLSAPPSSTEPSELARAKSISERLKILIKSYGWYALGVYTILSFLDFGVAFAAINVVGAEHVARFTKRVKDAVLDMLHRPPPEHHDPAPGSHSGLWAMIILAWTVHKTLFLPVRVGLTAAVTPRMVQWLRARGYAGAVGTRRAAQEVRERMREIRERRRDA